MDVFNLQAKIGLDVEEYMNGIKNAVNNSKKLVDAINKMAEKAVTAQTQTDKAGKSMQGAAENADALGKSVNGAVSPVDKMADAIDAIGKSTDNASQEIDGLSDSVEGVGESFDESAKDTDGLSDSIKDEAENAKKTTDENKKLGEETQNAGEKAKESSFNFEKLVDSLKNVTSTAGKVVTGIAKVGAGITATITAATAGTIAATVKGVSSLAEYGDAIDKQSQKVGLSAQAYQEWDAIMQHSGASISSMTASMRTLVNAAQSDSDALNALGISQQEALGMDQEKLFSAVITKLQNMEDQTQRTYLASKLLGRGAMEFGALLNTSAEDTEKMRQRVHELGGVLSDTAVKDAARFQDSLQDMKTGFSGLSRNLLSEFLPSFATVMDGITDIFAGDKEGGSKTIIKGLSDVTENVKNALPKILDIGDQFVSLADNLTPAIFATFGIVSDSIIKAISNIDVDKAIDNLFKLIDSGTGTAEKFADSIFGLFMSAAEKLPSKLPEFIDRISGVITAGLSNATTKLSKIGEIGGNLISLVLDGLEQNLPDILSGLNDFFGRLIQQLPKLIDGGSIGNVAKILIDGFIGGIDALIGNADVIFKLGADLIVGIGNGLAEALPNLIARIPEIIQAIADGITNNIDDIILTAETIISSLADGLAQSLPVLLDKAPVIIENFVNSIANHIDDVLQIAMMIFEAINEGILGNLDSILDSALSILKAVITGIVDNIDSVLLAAQEIISTLVDYLLQPDTLQTVIEAGAEILKELFVGLGKITGSVLGFVYELMGQLYNSIAEWIKDGSVGRMGIAILDGIIAGLTGVDGSFFGEFKDNFITGLKSIFNIHSPSKTMKDEIGTYIGQGLLDGFLSIDFLKEFDNKIGDAISKAKTWGADLMDNFANGIKSKWNSLVSTVTSVAQVVADYLHFSVPEKGPLADFDKSAPDMMELFAHGIRDNEHLITDQFDKSLGNLKAPELTAKMNAETAYSTSGYNQTGNTIGCTEAILTLLQAILQAVREGRIVAIDDAGFRTINEGLARIQRFDEGGAFV